MHGRGLYIFANGSRYEGEWSNDKRTGYGIYNYANGSAYEGYFNNGRREGKGNYKILMEIFIMVIGKIIGWKGKVLTFLKMEMYT